MPMPYEPVLLANIDKPDSHTLAVYEAGGGYRGAAPRAEGDDARRDVRRAGASRAICAAAAGPAFPPG